MVAPSGSTARAKAVAPKKKAIKEHVYTHLSVKSADAWFRRIQAEELKPNAEQLAYLHDIRDRCAIESQELKAGIGRKKQAPRSEPYRKCLLGPPGTGKSECIRWTRRFFEEVLGWEQGVQFQLVAPQHTMALLIGGTTVHSWGQVPINATSMQERMGQD